MNTGMFTTPNKMSWCIIQRTVDFSFIDFSGYFSLITLFIFMFITAKEGLSNKVVYNSVVEFILLIG